MGSIELWSDDCRLGIRLSAEVVLKIIMLCSESLNQETGGILVGRYTEDCRCAEITSVSDLPDDSNRGRTWFHRGIRGLGNWLQRCWKRRREYYVGEWHYHPLENVTPSYIDQTTMRQIAYSRTSSCPEPILLIIGTDSQGQMVISAIVFTKHSERIQLRAMGKEAVYLYID